MLVGIVFIGRIMDCCAVQHDLFHSLGYEIYNEKSEPVGPEFDVVPLSRILGLYPLIRLYRNLDGTIPVLASKQAQMAFPACCQSTDKDPGSKTYILNRLALKYSRQ